MKILAAEHPIKSVTVFKSSKAEIVRTFALELKVSFGSVFFAHMYAERSSQAGQNRIRITGLPGVIDPDSIRVSGLGQARLFDIVCTTGNSCESDSEDGDDDESDDDDEDDDGDQDYEDATAGEVARGKSKKPKDKQKSALEVLRRLNIKKSDLEAEKKVFEEELNLRSRYAKTLSAEHINPIEAKNYFNGFSDAMCSTLDDISKLNRKIVKVDRQIIRQTAKTQLKKGWTMGEVVVVVGADEKDNVELKLTYSKCLRLPFSRFISNLRDLVVGNVSWEPTYTLHASTENGKPSSTVTLQYRARVKQSTGEDWTDTALTLSTVASDATTQSIPHLKSMEIRPQLFKRDGFLRFAQQQQQQQLPSFGTTGFGAVAPPVQSQSQSQAANLSQTQQSRFAGFRQHPIQSTFAQQGVQNPAANPPQQPFGPFGSAAANPLQQSSGLFGSAPANPLQQSSGLFGSASANPPQPSGLFGQPAAANPPQQSNVFGQPAPQNPVANPPQPSGLFGQPPSQNQQQAGFFGQSVETAQNYTSSPDYNVIVPADDDSFEDVAVPGPSESTTIVSESPLAISYGVTGKATIPSDGIAHQVSIAVLPFESKITHVTIPRIKPNVYLQVLHHGDLLS